MEALKGYLVSAMVAALVSSLFLRVTDARYRGWIRYIAGLALLLMLAAPLIDLADGLSQSLADLDGYEEATGQAAEEQVVEEIGKSMSRQIGDTVAGQFHLPREKIRVKLTLDLSDLSAIGIYRVDLTVAADCSEQEIEAYLSEALGCPATVTVTKGERE